MRTYIHSAQNFRGATLKIVSVITTIFVLGAFGCSGARPPSNANFPSTLGSQHPTWIDRLILQFQNAPVGNPPQFIWKYDYQQRVVYYIPPQCCDQYSQLYDASGGLICAPDGGITGRGDGLCPDFLNLRKNEVLVWRDPRSRP